MLAVEMNIDFSNAGALTHHFHKDFILSSVNFSLLSTISGKSNLKIAIIPQSSFTFFGSTHCPNVTSPKLSVNLLRVLIFPYLTREPINPT